MLKVSAHICTQSILHVDMTFCALAHTYAKPFYVDLRLLCTHESTADIWRLRLPKMPQLGMPTVDNWDLLFDQWIPWCQYAYGRVTGEPKPSPLWLYWLVQLAERFFIRDPTNLMQKACARLFKICWHWHLRNVSYFKLNNPRKPLYSETLFYNAFPCNTSNTELTMMHSEATSIWSPTKILPETSFDESTINNINNT